MFAEIDANGWVLIIGAIFMGLGQLVTIVLGALARIQMNALAKADDKRGQKLDDLKDQLADNSETTSKTHDLVSAVVVPAVQKKD